MHFSWRHQANYGSLKGVEQRSPIIFGYFEIVFLGILKINDRRFTNINLNGLKIISLQVDDCNCFTLT